MITHKLSFTGSSQWFSIPTNSMKMPSCDTQSQGSIVGVKIFSLLVGVYSFNLYLINGAKHLYMAHLHSDVLQNVCLKIFAHLKNWVISYY